jgi:hypothetical protein
MQVAYSSVHAAGSWLIAPSFLGHRSPRMQRAILSWPSNLQLTQLAGRKSLGEQLQPCTRFQSRRLPEAATHVTHLPRSNRPEVNHGRWRQQFPAATLCGFGAPMAKVSGQAMNIDVRLDDAHEEVKSSVDVKNSPKKIHQPYTANMSDSRPLAACHVTYLHSVNSMWLSTRN